MHIKQMVDEYLYSTGQSQWFYAIMRRSSRSIFQQMLHSVVNTSMYFFHVQPVSIFKCYSIEYFAFDIDVLTRSSFCCSTDESSIDFQRIPPTSMNSFQPFSLMQCNVLSGRLNISKAHYMTFFLVVLMADLKFAVFAERSFSHVRSSHTLLYRCLFSLAGTTISATSTSPQTDRLSALKAPRDPQSTLFCQRHLMD